MNKTKGSGRTRRGDEYRCALSKANRENEQLKADNERFKSALEAIAGMQDYDPECSHYMEEAAKKALRGVEQ